MTSEVDKRNDPCLMNDLESGQDVSGSKMKERLAKYTCDIPMDDPMVLVRENVLASSNLEL